MAMIEVLARKCLVCGHVFIGMQNRIPAQCPNPACRSRRWNRSQDGSASVAVAPAFRCSRCRWEWLNKGKGKAPIRCARRGCRSRKWNRDLKPGQKVWTPPPEKPKHHPGCKCIGCEEDRKEGRK